MGSIRLMESPTISCLNFIVIDMRRLDEAMRGRLVRKFHYRGHIKSIFFLFINFYIVLNLRTRWWPIPMNWLGFVPSWRNRNRVRLKLIVHSFATLNIFAARNRVIWIVLLSIEKALDFLTRGFCWINGFLFCKLGLC